MNISEYKKLDPEFSESFVTEKVSNIYYRIKTSFSDGVPEEVEPYISPEYYSSLTGDYEKMKSDGKLLYTERLTVLGSEITGIKHTDDTDCINLSLRVRAVEYYVNPQTKAYISGSKNEDFRNVNVVISRPSGLTTVVQKGINSLNCPYCGAPLNINKTAKCEYCGSILNSDCFNWQFIQL